MNNVYAVNIAGKELRIVTDEEESYVTELAQRLDRAISDAIINNCGAGKFDGALLCALEAMDAAIKASSKARMLAEDNARLLEQLNRARGNNGRR